MPLVLSMTSDMYPAHDRPLIMALVGLAVGIGVGSGQFMAAVVCTDMGYGWKVPFAVASVPSCISAVIFYLFAEEPLRYSQETTAAGARSTTALEYADEGSEQDYSIPERLSAIVTKTRELIMRPTNFILIYQSVPGCIPWAIPSVIFFILSPGSESRSMHLHTHTHTHTHTLTHTHTHLHVHIYAWGPL
jgi:hypothetical protein